MVKVKFHDNARFPQEIRELIFNEIYNEKGVYAENVVNKITT